VSELSAPSAASFLPEEDWSEVAGAQIPEYLLDLRTSAIGINARRKRDGGRFAAHVGRLTHDLVEMVIHQVPGSDSPALCRGETIWCFVYAQEYALSFVLRVEEVQDDRFRADFPGAMWIRKERRHRRFIPRVPIQSTWRRPGASDITGDVMDIGLGGFLGGVNVVAHSDPESEPREDDRGVVSLRRGDGAVWIGEGILRRVCWVGDPDDEESIAFVLLGFAFTFADEQGARRLTEFLDGFLEPL